MENPRLITSAANAAGGGPSREAADAADRTEFLDDRVVLFTPAGRTGRTFRYALRVTTAGAFQLPPMQASCMYDPSFACVSGGGQVQVGR